MTVVKDAAPVAAERGELAHQYTAEASWQIFERLARDPNVDVDRLERLIQMHERATARVAQEQFNAAMTAAQKEMRSVAPDAYNPQTKSRYASYEALDRALRPIYTAHGFGLSFNTGESSVADSVLVLCKVSHAGGHAEVYHIVIPADGKGAKGGDVMTKTHATGAAVSYGMRYLLKMIFNVAVGEADDDGNTASVKAATPQPPKGYADWLTDLRATADNGHEAIRAAWKQSPQVFRDYLEKHAKGELESLRAKAKQADAARKDGA
jgi:hypothetical protein